MTFSQSTGVLTVGPIKWTGYAGRDAGKDNPAMQDRANVGPLPRGTYTVSLEPFVHDRCGQYCLRLTPDPANEMFGRSGFLIHGDSIERPGTASHGCIVVPRGARQAIVACGDSLLEVTS